MLLTYQKCHTWKHSFENSFALPNNLGVSRFACWLKIKIKTKADPMWKMVFSMHSKFNNSMVQENGKSRIGARAFQVSFPFSALLHLYIQIRVIQI
jgi:hypothetical protein